MARVVPGMTELTGPYWEAAREKRLVVQECQSCRQLWHPPLPRCPHCHAADPGWRQVSGDGTIYTYTVVRHPTHSALADSPVRPRHRRAGRGTAPGHRDHRRRAGRVRAGTPVRVRFPYVADGVTLPYFEPAVRAGDDQGLLDGKVAFVTGAARGQGRSHAVRLAQEGADIIALDACATPDWLSYPLATEADLAQTVKEVEALDRRIIARKADIRDLAAVAAVLAEGLAELGGRLDIVAANAAIISWPKDTWAIDVAEFRELIDVTLTGTFITVKAAVPPMIAAGNGGSIVADLLRRGDHRGQGPRPTTRRPRRACSRSRTPSPTSSPSTSSGSTRSARPPSTRR